MQNYNFFRENVIYTPQVYSITNKKLNISKSLGMQIRINSFMYT